MGSAETHANVTVGTSTVFTALACLFIALRCIARFGLLKKVGSEDVLAIVALGISIINLVIVWIMRPLGLGVHRSQLPQGQYVQLLRFYWVGTVTYGLSLMLAKVAILVQLLHIFTTRKQKIWMRILLVLAIVNGIMLMVGPTVTCGVSPFFWNKTSSNSACSNPQLAYIGLVWNTLLDFVTWAIPIYIVKNLNMNRKQKVYLVVTFSLGFLCCVVAILRLWPLYEQVRSGDISRTCGLNMMFGSFEVNIGLICGSLPLLTPLIYRLFPSMQPKTQVAPNYPRRVDAHGNTHDPHNPLLSGETMQGSMQGSLSSYKLKHMATASQVDTLSSAEP